MGTMNPNKPIGRHPSGIKHKDDLVYWRAFAKALMAATGHVVVELNSKGAVLRANPPARDIFGLTPGSSLPDVIPDLWPAVVDALENNRAHSGTHLEIRERAYRFWITPKEGGRQSVPPLRLSYFDPQSGRYEVTQSRPIPVFVSGDPTALGHDTGSERSNFIAPDIRLIREGATISSVTVPRMYRSRWFWLLAAAPGLLFFSVVAVDRVRGRMRKDTPRARLRRARGRARKRFRVAEIHIRGNRPSRFFGELAHVIHEHLEERVGQPVRQMTRAELREFLASRGFAETTIKRIDDEIQNCDFARFAPAASGPGEMKAALRRTRELLREIEKTRLVGDAQSADESEGGE